MNILIVDDDPGDRLLLKSIIKQQGHSVLEAADGVEGLALAREHRPDAIISDALMPRMDGFQFLREVRRDARLGPVLFVIRTAIFNEEKERNLTLSLGADALIDKSESNVDFWKEFTKAVQAHASKKKQPVQGPSADREEAELKNYCQMVVSKLEEKVREQERTIAAHERTKKVLRESEERYRLLFDSNPHPMWVYDLETLAFLAVNDAAVLQYGYSREEFLSMTIKDIRPREEAARLLEKVSRTIEGVDAAGVWEHRKKDGTSFAAEITTHTLMFDARPAKLVMAMDVTGRRRMEKAIRDASDEWRGTFDAMNDAIALLDRDGNILRCNLSMTKLAGKQFQELIGRPCREIMRNTSGPVVSCPYEIMKKTLKREALVAQMGERWFNVTTDPIFDTEGNLAGAIHIMADITFRKRSEEALKASEEKFRTLFESANDSIFILDMNGNIMDSNRAGYEQRGYTKEELLNKHVSEIDAPESAAKALERVTRIREQGSAVFEAAHVRKDGVVLPVEINAKAMDFEGRKVIFSIIRDISDRKKAEDVLKEEKNKARTFLDIAGVLIVALDAGGRVTLINKKGRELTGYDEREIMGRNWFELCIPEPKREKARSAFSSLMNGDVETAEYFENPIRTKSGSERLVAFHNTVVRAESGDITGTLSSGEDITEQKWAYDQLNQRAHQAALGAEIGVALTRGGDLRDILQRCAEAMTRHLDAAFSRIWTLNEREKVLELQASAGMYTHINGAHGRVPVGKFKIGLIAEERKPHLTNQVVGDPRVGDQEWARKEGMVAFAGYPLIVQDRLVGVMALFSRTRIAEATMSSLASVADVIAVGIERKINEESLREYGKELTALNMASNTLMLITNLGDLYPAICDIVYSVFSMKMVWLGLIEKGVYEVKPVAYAGEDAGYLSSIKITWDDSPTGMGPTGLAIKTMKSQKTNVMDPSFAPWSEAAQLRGYVASLSVPLIYARDKCLGALNFYSDSVDYFTPDRIKICEIFANQASIAIENASLIEGLEVKIVERTEDLEATNYELQKTNDELRLRREEAEAGSRSKSDFLANMSHELRTPLNAVIGLSQVLLEQSYGPLNPKQAEYLEGVRQSGNHLLELINEILDLSKIEAGKEEYEPAVFPMNAALQNAFMMVREKAMKHGIELVQDIGPEVGAFYADERRIKQILFNLLSNAVKFTEPGGKVGLTARQDERTLTMTVWDTGVGIPENKKHLLFQPFQQLDSSLSKKHEGTGLGLVLSKRLVELHGGTITFGPREGGGANFMVTLPVPGLARAGTQPRADQAQAKHQEKSGLVAGKKIMIVEDNRLNMLLAADFLKAKSFKIIEAETGELALEKAALEKPDLILLDIQMPGIDGFEVIKRLREDSALKNIPVIAMTALAMKGDEERCLRAGFDDYISKPINQTELLKKIERRLAPESIQE